MDSTLNPEDDNTSIFNNREFLTPDIIPDEIIDREEVVSECATALERIVQDWGEFDMLLYGESGLGKTTVMHNLVKFVENEIRDAELELTQCWVDCSEYPSVYESLRFLANDVSDEFYKQGHPPSTLVKAIQDGVSSTSDYIVLILDNLEDLEGESDPFARFKEINVSAELCIIGLFNGKPDFGRAGFDVDWKRPGYYEIEFPLYTIDQLNDILQYHADIAFLDGVLTPGVLELCAAQAKQLTGDAQIALDLLRLSGDIADNEDAKKVEETHVRRAMENVEQLEIKRQFANLNYEERVMCLLIAFNEIVNAEEITFSQLYNNYVDAAEKVDLNPVGQRRARDYVSTLAPEFIDSNTHNRGSRGGIWRSYSLVVSPYVIVDAASEGILPVDSLLTYEIERALNEEVGDR